MEEPQLPPAPLPSPPEGDSPPPLPPSEASSQALARSRRKLWYPACQSLLNQLKLALFEGRGHKLTGYEVAKLMKIFSRLAENFLDGFQEVITLILASKEHAENRVVELRIGMLSLLEALKEKGVLTEEDITKAWEQKVKPEIEKARQEALAATQSQSPEAQVPSAEQPPAPVEPASEKETGD